MIKAGKARLVYYILEQRLDGRAGGQHVALHACSGGWRRDQKNWSANNPYGVQHQTGHATGAKSPSAESHGGPIPPGQYRVLSPSRTAKEFPGFVNKPGIGCAAYLAPQPGTRLYGRSGFFIHKGKHTDGCIVPLHPTQFNRLMAALDEDGGGILQVVSSIEPYEFA
jgi:hypothetical protein